MTHKYWFAAKPPENGWGWGQALTWQGRLVYAAFILLLIGGAILITPHGAHYFIAFTFALAGLLVFICWRKGEPPGRLPGGGR